MTQYLFGSSDDLIELEGDVCEEFTTTLDSSGFVAFSTGTVLRIRYSGEGEWEIRHVAGPEVQILPARHKDDGELDEHGCPGYSDKAVIEDEVGWVVYGADYASA